MSADKNTRLAIYRTMVTIRQFETMAGEYFAAGQITGFASNLLQAGFSVVGAIAATLGQIAWVKYRHGKVDGMLIASGVIILVFGGATLLLRIFGRLPDDLVLADTVLGPSLTKLGPGSVLVAMAWAGAPLSRK